MTVGLLLTIVAGVLSGSLTFRSIRPAIADIAAQNGAGNFRKCQNDYFNIGMFVVNLFGLSLLAYVRGP